MDLARILGHKIETQEEKIIRVMNCPFALGVDKRFRKGLVDKESCFFCTLSDCQKGCAYSEALIKTEREAIFDEKSETALFVWRLRCHHCGQQVIIVSRYENMSTGDNGRCMGCGAWHYYIHSECDEGDYFVISSKTDKKTLKAVRKWDKERQYVARIPDIEKARKRSKK